MNLHEIRATHDDLLAWMHRHHDGAYTFEIRPHPIRGDHVWAKGRDRDYWFDNGSVTSWQEYHEQDIRT